MSDPVERWFTYEEDAKDFAQRERKKGRDPSGIAFIAIWALEQIGRFQRVVAAKVKILSDGNIEVIQLT